MAIIGEAISVLALKAKIHVNTMPGSTVVFSGPGMSVTLYADAYGNCTCEVPVPNFGSFTIASYNGNASGSGSVYVGAVTDYYVTVGMTLWVIQNGNFASWTGHNRVGGGSNATFSDQGDYVELRTYQGGSNDNIAGYITPAVDFTYWNTLYIDSQEKGDKAYAGPASNNSSNPPSFNASVRLVGKVETWDSRHTSSCNVAGVGGNQYIALHAKAWIEQYSQAVWIGTGGNIRVWNLWLQR